MSPSPKQTEFGNEVVDEVRRAVKVIGWEDTAFAAMCVHMQAFAAFTKRIPDGGRPGQTITTDAGFFDEWQEAVGSIALLSATLAEKVGAGLKQNVPTTN